MADNDFRLDQIAQPRISHGEVLMKADACAKMEGGRGPGKAILTP